MMRQRTRLLFRTATDLTFTALHIGMVLGLAAVMIVGGVLGVGGAAGIFICVVGILMVCWVVATVVKIRYQTRTTIRKELKRRGLCQACGYDLRASRERCPECGNHVPGAPSKSIEV